MNREKLIQAGVDYDEGVERFGGNSAVFEKYLAKFFAGGYLEQIEKQLAAGDIADAFRATHDLKALAGNLSINHCYQAICALTEQLRSQRPDADYAKELSQAKLWYDRARAAAEAEQ